MKNYKSISFEAPQGQSSEDFPMQKNLEFLDFLASGVKKEIVKDEVSNFKKFDIGSPQVNLINPANPLANKSEIYNTSWMNSAPQSAPYNADNTLFPQITSPNAIQLQQGTDFSKANNQIPSYVDSFVKANPYDPYKQTPAPPVDHSRRNNNIADITMAGIQTVNGFFDRYYANQQNKKNQQKFGIESTAQTQYGNRGDYDVNSGAFRPDQYTVPGFKKGGELPKFPNGGSYEEPINKVQRFGDELKDMPSEWDLLKYGKYISDPAKRKHQMENVYYKLRDDGNGHEEAIQWLQKLGAYGSERGPIVAKDNEWGWDSAQVPEHFMSEYSKTLGRFKPTYKAPPALVAGEGPKKYKKGGQYTVSDSEISELLAGGYDFDIID